jgi:hypothetical protein
LTTLGLADGAYEYEFVIDRGHRTWFTAADPYAEEIVMANCRRQTYAEI